MCPWLRRSSSFNESTILLALRRRAQEGHCSRSGAGRTASSSRGYVLTLMTSMAFVEISGARTSKEPPGRRQEARAQRAEAAAKLLHLYRESAVTVALAPVAAAPFAAWRRATKMHGSTVRMSAHVDIHASGKARRIFVVAMLQLQPCAACDSGNHATSNNVKGWGAHRATATAHQRRHGPSSWP